MLKWARENGCPWDQDTCASRRGGHLEVLKWARANDCPWDEREGVRVRVQGAATSRC